MEVGNRGKGGGGTAVVVVGMMEVGSLVSLLMGVVVVVVVVVEVLTDCYKLDPAKARGEGRAGAGTCSDCLSTRAAKRNPC